MQRSESSDEAVASEDKERGRDSNLDPADETAPLPFALAGVWLGARSRSSPTPATLHLSQAIRSKRWSFAMPMVLSRTPCRAGRRYSVSVACCRVPVRHRGWCCLCRELVTPRSPDSSSKVRGVLPCPVSSCRVFHITYTLLTPSASAFALQRSPRLLPSALTRVTRSDRCP